MKKLFGLVLAVMCSMNMFADRLFMVGDATPQGWNVGTDQMKTTELIETAPGIFTWTGKLYVGGEGFKVSTAIGQWGNWHPSNPDRKLDQSSDTMREGDPDTKWQVSEEGIYTVTINWNTKQISAVKETYELTKDGDYYMLGTAEDLFYYSQWTVHGVLENTAKAKLTADIDFTAAKYKYASLGVGGNADCKSCYSGEFDGQGHTITIAIEDLRDRTGLFGFVRDATIKNLVVDGTVTSDDRNCIGGLGGRVDGGVSVENVIVKTAVTYTGSNGDATAGGFFANMEGNSTLTNCAFIGSINTGSAEGNGGLVGWAGSGSNNKYYNCYVAPTSYTKNGNSAEYARNSPSVTNCYYEAYDDPRFATGELCYLLNGKVSGGENWYQTIGTDKMPVPFATSAKVYANGALDCAGNSKGGDLVYSNSAGGSRDPHNYVDGFCSVCHELNVNHITPVDGYLPLATAADVVWFSALVNAGNTSKNAKLTADIDMTGVEYTPIGTGANKYSGTFNGQNHTVDNIVIKGKSYSGFFGYLTGGANIQNLVIGAGCAFSGDIKIGGLASMADGGGTVTLSRVVNMASATSSTSAADANAAGLISCCVGGTKVDATYCLNAGTITGKPGECAAFTGWSQGGSSYTNCLNIAEISGMQDNRNLYRGDAVATNCYDTRYSTQSTKVDDAKLATGELCFIMNGSVNGGENWFQTLPGDATPLPLTNHGKVYQNGDFYCDRVTAKGTSSYSNVEGATYEEHNFDAEHISCTNANNCGTVNQTYKSLADEKVNGNSVYELSNLVDLAWFGKMVDQVDATINGRLLANVEQESANYAPIGTTDHPYHGKFYGDFHTITLNLPENGWADNQGIFGVLTGGAEIYNLTAAGKVQGKQGAAGIAGCANGGGKVLFVNCGNEAAVEATKANAAGILGVDMLSSCAIQMINCYNAGAINGYESGGLSGWAGGNPSYINCYTSGTVTGDGSNNFSRQNGDNIEFINVWHEGNIEGDMLTSGKLCYTLGDVNFRQEIGVDAHPVLSDVKPSVYAFSVGEAGWRTLVAERGMDFSAIEGATAYHVVNVTNYVELDGTLKGVPAGEAVLVEAAEGEYYYNACDPAGTPGNLLIAATEDVTADGTQYILAKPEEKEVGFYRATPGSTIKAGKAYLVSASGINALYFDEDATGINGVEAIAGENQSLYNLAGQRISVMQRGVNIVNGKKVLK